MKWFGARSKERARVLAALESIALHFESRANGAGAEQQSAALADLEARVAQHIAALTRDVADLKTRAPPEADLVKRIAALEFDSDASKRHINSIRGQVNRAKPRREEQYSAVMGSAPSFLHGIPPLQAQVLGAEEREEGEEDG